MYKILAFVPKQDGLTLQEFRSTYEEEHVPLALSFGVTPLVYKRHYIDRDAPIVKGTVPVDFDVVTEVAFEDKSGFFGWISQFVGNDEFAAAEAKLVKSAAIKVFEVDEKITVETKVEDLSAQGITKPFDVVVLASKKPGDELATYKEYYENEHVAVLLRFGPKAYSYKRLYVDRLGNLRGGSEELSFDSIALVTFESEDAFQQEGMATVNSEESMAVIDASEAKFMDREVKTLFAAETFVSFDV